MVAKHNEVIINRLAALRRATDKIAQPQRHMWIKFVIKLLRHNNDPVKINVILFRVISVYPEVALDDVANIIANTGDE